MNSEPHFLGKVSAEDAKRAWEDAHTCKTAFTRARAEYIILKARLVWAQFARGLRKLAIRVEGKPVLAFIVATACFGLVAPLLIFCALGLKGVLIGASVGFLLGGAASAVCLYFPRDRHLVESLTQLPSAIQYKKEHVEQLRQRYHEAFERYGRLHQIVESRKNRLLRSDWRVLTGIPFEQFLAEVFEELGYRVEITKASGDQGVDLILVQDTQRIAVQAKGYSGSVGNKAIQEAYTGMCIYACNQCVVVTNSQFTSGAYEAAAKTTCVLISGDQIPDLILGKIL
jgi:restriction system protein